VITSGVALAATSVTAASLVRVPPGPCTLLLANAGTAATAYAAPGTAATSANGFPLAGVPTVPVTIPVYPGSAAGTWSVVTASGSATVAWIISTPSGGTGP
jgi:hypothetical protein